MRDAPRRGVVLVSLAAILLLAAAVCALHIVNALTLRGTARVSDYTPLARVAQNMPMEEALWGVAQLPVYADGERSFALWLREPEETDGMLCISGALLRPEQAVGEVRVRVGLIPSERPEEIVLLNTQMVRWTQPAQALGVDDHCGFAASAARRLLGDGQYTVVLVDESDGARRLIDVGMDIALSRDGLTVSRSGGEREAGA